MHFPEGVARAEDVATVLGRVAPASPDDMRALEVIWSPSEENDRMSSLELEQLYPELIPLGSGVGRYVCGFCRAPFPRELVPDLRRPGRRVIAPLSSSCAPR